MGQVRVAQLGLLGVAAALGALLPIPEGRGQAIGELTHHVRCRQWRHALTLIEQLDERSAGETLHYNLALQACRRAGQWEPAIGLFERMLARAGGAPSPDAASFTTAVSALSDAPPSSWRVAMRLLGEIRAELGEAAVDDDSLRSCFNAAISTLARDRQSELAVELLREMQSAGPAPDTITYNAVLGALGAAGESRRVLGLLEEMELCSGAAGHGELDELDDLDGLDGAWSYQEAPITFVRRTERSPPAPAPAVVDAPPPDAISYVAAMGACRRAGEWRAAVWLLRRMRTHGIAPNAHAFSAAISACACAGEWVAAVALLEKMEAAGLPPSAVAYAAAITACDRGGAWERALKLLEEMELRGVRHSSTHAYNAAISACARAAEWRPALSLLGQMVERKRNAPPPDVYSFNGALSACDRAGECKEALTLRRRMGQAGVRPDAVTDNILLSAFARAARWHSALALLRAMGAREAPRRARPDPVPLCTAAAACEAAGEWRACLALVAPLLSLPLAEPSPPPLAAAAAAAARAAGGVPTAAIAPAVGCAVRASVRAGEVATALQLVEAAERLGSSCLAASAYAAARDAAAAAGDTAAAARMAAHAAAAGAAGGEGGGERGFRVEAAAGIGGAARSGAGAFARASSAKSEAALARFVLEGAQVACANGANRSSAADVFLVRARDDSAIVATVDAAREAQALVLWMGRKTDYSPVLSALPARLQRKGAVSPARARLVLAQHAEKKALAAQLALGASTG